MKKSLFAIRVLIRRFISCLLCLCLASAPQTVVANEADTVFFPTHQMLYVNQFFNKDGSWSEMGLELCKWIDMSKRDTVDRINSGYLMLEEEYLYQQNTKWQGDYVKFANQAMEVISDPAGTAISSAANYAAMASKFGSVGAKALPYYEYLSEIYLSFIQCLEQEMSTMDIALDAIIGLVGNGVEIALEDGLPTIVKKLKKSDLWNSLTVDQKYALDAADKMMNREFPPLRKYQQMIDEVGIAFDFAETAASWVDVFTTKENLTIQQQMYMAAFSQVTDDHLEVLLNLRENLHKYSSLSANELKCVDGAIGALICDIHATRNNHMEAAAQAKWNANLGTIGSLSKAIYSSGFDNVLATQIDSLLAAHKIPSKGISAIQAVATVGSFVLSLTSQDFLDVREQTEAIYNLKKSMVESLELQLHEYVTNPSHEQAVAIISSLKLLKQAKLSGEEVIALFYIAREADTFGLENSPAAQAILWNELITCNALGEYDLGAEDYIESIWTVYQNSIKYDNILNNTLYCHIESTPIAYYRYDTSAVSYQGEKLSSIPHSFMSAVNDGEWTPTDDYVRWALIQPNANDVKWYSRKFASNPENLTSLDELERLAKRVSDAKFATQPLPINDTKLLESFSREKEYVYSRGNVEVRISIDEFAKYLVAEKQVEQLMNAYKDTSSLEYNDHQAEERLIWTKVTNGYIESFPMYDPLEIYVEAVQIIDQPKDIVVTEGENATVSLTATGEGVTYSWYCANTGSDEFTLSTSHTSNNYSIIMSAENDGYQVYCVITDIYGNSVISDTVTLSATHSMSFEEIQRLLGLNGFYNADSFQDGLAAVATEWRSITNYDDYHSRDGKAWGFINTQGEFVINPMWDYVHNEISEGIIEVKKDGKRTYLDIASNTVIGGLWESGALDLFHDGVAHFSANSFDGYIDKQGNVIFEMPSEWLQNDCYYSFRFSDGLARITFDDYRNGVYHSQYIDSQGNVVLEWNDEAFDFSEGLALAKKDRKCGYIDKSGNVAIDFQWFSAGDFCNGFAKVYMDRKWGFIDTSGTVVIDYQWEKVENFYEGFAWVKQNGKWGAIDTQGNVVIEPQWDDDTYSFYHRFYDGIARVKKNGKYGFVDTKGNIVSEPQWDSVSIFSEGLSRVEKDGKYGFIDTKGNIISTPQWNDAGLFSEGLASVKISAQSTDSKDVWGYIDSQGKMVIEPQAWESVGAFANGLALVSVRVDRHLRYGYIDIQGNVVIGISPIESNTPAH